MTATPPELADEADLLARCPRCRYRLRGLPVRHACPECGLEVDRRWQVFGGQALPSSVMRTGRPIAWIALGVLLWTAASGIVQMLVAGRVTLIVMAFTAGALAAAAGVYYASFRRPRSFVALAPDELIVFRDDTAPQRFAWKDVGRARYDIASRSLVFPVGDRTVRLRGMEFFRWYVSELDRCVRAINNHPRPAATPGAAQPAADRHDQSADNPAGS